MSLEEALRLTCNLFSKEAVSKPYQLFVGCIYLLGPAKLKKKKKKKTFWCKDIMYLQTQCQSCLNVTSTVTPGLPDQDSVNAVPDEEN